MILLTLLLMMTLSLLLGVKDLSGAKKRCLKPFPGHTLDKHTKRYAKSCREDIKPLTGEHFSD